MEQRVTGEIKICHMTSVHNRYDGRILMRECMSLQEAGYNVYLVVADDKPEEIKNGVKIYSIGLAAKNRLERMSKAAKGVFQKALEIDAAVYHLHDPELLPYACRLKKLGKKVIFDSHEDTVDQILDKKYFVVPRFVSKIFESYQNSVVKALDAVIIVSPNLGVHFRTAKDHIHLVTNYPELSPSPEKRKRKRQVCFTGGCKDIWCNTEIAEAVSELDCKYLMAGPSESDYMDTVVRSGKGKAQYLGQLDRQAVFRLQAESIAGMMVCKSAQLIRNGGTLGNTKMFEYMMNGLPIICSDVTLWREIVEEYKCGICVDPFDVQSVRRGIQYILENPERAEKMGENGRKAVEERYNWKTQKEELIKIYQEVISN